MAKVTTFVEEVAN